MKTNCLNCGKENPKKEMKTCCRKCAGELKKRNSREMRECLYCKEKFEVRKKKIKTLCSEECRKKWAILPENVENRIQKSKGAIKEKFGVDNVFQLEEIKNKSKKTKKEKYGDENYNNFEKMLNTKKEKYGDEYLKNWYKSVENSLKENYGVSHGLHIQKFKKKQEDTNFERYGVKNVSQNEDVKKKRTKTIKSKFGVENASQNEDVKKKKKETSMKNFGVSHHLKDSKMFLKHQKAQFKVKKYKNTELYYQGSYELYFLEKMEEKGKLKKVQNGKSYDYKYNNESHVYHTDFFYNDSNIEIKSGWTYNKNGEDKALEEINKTKWKSVVEFGDKIKVLISKEQISLFVDGLI